MALRAGDGELFKVVIEELHTDPHALRRFVRLRYAPVEARDGGGVVRVKGALASTSVSGKEVAGIRELFHPPAGFRARLAHKVENVPFIGIERLPLEFVLERSGAFVVGGARSRISVGSTTATRAPPEAPVRGRSARSEDAVCYDRQRCRIWTRSRSDLRHRRTARTRYA